MLRALSHIAITITVVNIRHATKAIVIVTVMITYDAAIERHTPLLTTTTQSLFTTLRSSLSSHHRHLPYRFVTITMLIALRRHTML